MSGDNYFYGNTVNMHDGTNNTGMVNHQSGTVGAQATSPAMEAAVQELLRLLVELRGNVPTGTAQSLDATLPAITAGPATEPEERRRALDRIAEIAGAAGAIGAPLVAAVERVIALL
ncbi:hypothetical protein [Streptomyces sp. NBC_01353]|uniref:hypothetical protein n=1 Tax=Streptomyces sp. NBC_01353 TaxID=2903835 RepID=UPI002E344E88|nr:hypothetical protein [Streptomyces sp. NBC_01353]